MRNIFLFEAPSAHVGRRTLAGAVAQCWAARGRAVAVVGSGPGAANEFQSASIDKSWLSRHQGLSPRLCRNTLLPREGCPLWVDWSAVELPEERHLILSCLAEAFDALLVVDEREKTWSDVRYFDQAAALLWIVTPEHNPRPAWESVLSHLARFHLPNRIARRVWNRVPHGATSGGPASPQDVEAIAEIPEDHGAPFRQAIRQLASRLEEFQRNAHVSACPAAAKDAIVAAVQEQVRPQLLENLSNKGDAKKDSGATEKAVARETIEAALAAQGDLPESREIRGEIVTRVLEEVLGLGPIEPLLKDPTVSEVLVNGPVQIYVERQGKLQPTSTQFASEAQLRTIIDRIVAPIGRRVDESMPLCDARLADGSRVNIVLPPLALDGPVVTIRKFGNQALSLDDLAHLGSMSQAMADFLAGAVAGRQNVVVSGGTGSGKTTLLNALSGAIPEDERIVTIEDAAELRLQKPHVVRLESRPPNAENEGAIPIRRLVINALRMRPDRIVVGECRGGEALDMLQAMNTGHDGSLTTVHANSPRDALGRLETLALMAGMELPVRVVREQIRSAVHLIVQQARLADGSRKVTSITEVTGMEGETLTTQELFRYGTSGFEVTGCRSVRGIR